MQFAYLLDFLLSDNIFYILYPHLKCLQYFIPFFIMQDSLYIILIMNNSRCTSMIHLLR